LTICSANLAEFAVSHQEPAEAYAVPASYRFAEPA